MSLPRIVSKIPALMPHAIGAASGLALGVLMLRWTAPTPAQWAQTDQRCRTMLCDPDLSPAYWIRGTSFEAWLHTPAALHGAIAVLTISVGLMLAMVGLAARWPTKAGA
jgi:hypothetical protein